MIDLALLDTMERNSLTKELRKVIEQILSEDQLALPLNQQERERFCREVEDEVLGLGPIEPFMHEPDHHGYTGQHIPASVRGAVWQLHLTGARFKDDAHLRRSSTALSARSVAGSTSQPPWLTHG